MTTNPTDVQKDMMTDDEEDEEEETPSWSTPSSGPKPEDMAAAYLAQQEDWPAKTILDINDPARVAVLEQWDELFPECAHHQPIYDGFLETFLKSRTSVNGNSREEYRKILTSMFGGSPEDSKGSVVLSALGADIED
jgi:hypothetical protein